MDSVPKAAEISSTVGIPVERVWTKHAVFAEEGIDNFTDKDSSGGADNLKFLCSWS